MKKDDELWLKKMKEMLNDYTEPSPAGGWERLEKEISPPIGRRILIYRICTGVAAAILLAVGGVGIYLVNSPVTDDIRNVAITKMNPVPDNLPSIPEPGKASAQIEPVGEISGKIFIVQAKKHLDITEEGDPVTENDHTKENISDIEDVEIDDAEKENTVIENKQTDKSDPVIEDSSRRPVRPSGKDKLHLPIGKNKSKSSDGKWSMALSFNSGAGNSLSDDGGGYQPGFEGLHMNQFAAIGQAASTDYLELKDKELIFNNGLPYTKQAESLAYDHKQPITVGLSVRKRLSGKFSVETGLTYTYLLSDVFKQAEEKTKLGEQKLHYIGIPLRVNWNFLDTDRFTLYLTVGGTLEKCVYGKTVDETKTVKSNTVKQLQTSVIGGVGAQFNITRKIGIYAEPGVAYFFKDGSDTETIRKENPFNINLQAGIRLTY